MNSVFICFNFFRLNLKSHAYKAFAFTDDDYCFLLVELSYRYNKRKHRLSDDNKKIYVTERVNLNKFKEKDLE